MSKGKRVLPEFLNQKPAEPPLRGSGKAKLPKGQKRRPIWKTPEQRFDVLLGLDTTEKILTHIRNDGRVFTRHFFFGDGKIKHALSQNQTYLRHGKRVPLDLVDNFKLFQEVVNRNKGGNTQRWRGYVTRNKPAVLAFLSNHKLSTNQQISLVSKICSHFYRKGTIITAEVLERDFAGKLQQMIKDSPAKVRGPKRHTRFNDPVSMGVYEQRVIDLVKRRLEWPANAPLSIPEFARLVVQESSPNNYFRRLGNRMNALYLEQFGTGWTEKPRSASQKKSKKGSKKASHKKSKKGSKKRSASPKKRAASKKRSASPKKRAASKKRSASPKKRAASKKRSASPKRKAASNNRSASPKRKASPVRKPSPKKKSQHKKA